MSKKHKKKTVMANSVAEEVSQNKKNQSGLEDVAIKSVLNSLMVKMTNAESAQRTADERYQTLGDNVLRLTNNISDITIALGSLSTRIQQLEDAGALNKRLLATQDDEHQDIKNVSTDLCKLREKLETLSNKVESNHKNENYRDCGTIYGKL